jgi:multiple antibiotic resistance protein
MFEDFVHQIFWPFFLGGLVGLMSISNPLSKIPLFVSLTEAMSSEERAATARKASIYGFAMLIGTLFFGVLVLAAFGISFGALRIAGGLTIALVGYRMLFGYGYVGMAPSGSQQTPPCSPRAAGYQRARRDCRGDRHLHRDRGARVGGEEGNRLCGDDRQHTHHLHFDLDHLPVGAPPVARHGRRRLEAITRIMGFLLVCIGVQFVGSGVRTFIAGQ